MSQDEPNAAQRTPDSLEDLRRMQSEYLLLRDRDFARYLYGQRMPVPECNEPSTFDLTATYNKAACLEVLAAMGPDRNAGEWSRTLEIPALEVLRICWDHGLPIKGYDPVNRPRPGGDR